MSIALVVVLVLLGIYLLRETRLGVTLHEGFAVPRRSDTGLSSDGWKEEGSWARDLRYSEAFVDIAGRGVAVDFCRAIQRKGDPGSLHMACALGTRDGMDTMEYKSRTVAEGFRFSRDDYWRVGKHGRMDYCRILRDADTGEWYASAVIAGPDGFRRLEERDTEPPAAIQSLLDAYDGALVWWRWHDDEEDYAGNAVYERHGAPKAPTMLRPEKTRGLELNRWPAAAQATLQPAPAPRDYLRWGESGRLTLEDKIAPRQIRAIAFWVFWDAVEKGATIVECSNGGKRDALRLFVEGGGPDLPAAPAVTEAAMEVRPAHRLAIGQLTEPGQLRPPQVSPIPIPMPIEKSGAYVFEIWDEEARLMRIESGAGSVVAGQWQHVVVTTADATTWWPTWRMYVDGALVAEKRDGRMSPAMELTQNYVGRGLRGCLQDFRVYSGPMSAAKIESAIAWGRPLLHPTP
jgi:hypothetical protein